MQNCLKIFFFSRELLNWTLRKGILHYRGLWSTHWKSACGEEFYVITMNGNGIKMRRMLVVKSSDVRTINGNGIKMRRVTGQSKWEMSKWEISSRSPVRGYYLNLMHTIVLPSWVGTTASAVNEECIYYLTGSNLVIWIQVNLTCKGQRCTLNKMSGSADAH